MTPIDFQSIPSGLTLTPERIDELHRRSAETAQAFTRRLGHITQALDEARARFEREADELVASAPDPESRRAAQQMAKNRLAKQVGEFRRTLVASSETDRNDMLRQLNAWAEEATQLAALHATPVQHLGGLALGDSRRLYIQQTLAEAGPVELERAARAAIMTNDLPMAAAIVTVVDRRPRDRRPGFSPADFAARVVGVQHAEITGKLAAVQLAFKSSLTGNREFERGRPDPHANLALAVARRAAAPTKQTEEA
jgi:hypothetical protein